MHSHRLLTLLAAVALAGCQTYSPKPVDLAAHARLFAARVPDAGSIGEFVARLRPHDAAAAGFDPADGIELREARYITLLFNPELRTSRLRAGVAKVSAENAGRWADPELRADFFRILESVDHPWLAGGALGLTLPITGRPGLEKDLAGSRHAEALVEARLAEARTLDALEAHWAQWSASRVRVELLTDLLARLGALETIATGLAQAQLINQLAARTFSLERVARQAELLRAEAMVAAAEIDLKRVMGLPPGGAVRLLPATSLEVRVPDPAQRQTRTLDGPRIVLRQREHDVTERQLALAIRRQWPELTLFPGFQEEDAQPRAALGFSLPLPLWNANAREIAEARATRDVAAQALRGEVERAIQDLARAEVRAQAAIAQRALVDTVLVPLAEQQVADGRRLVELGQLDTLLILDSLLRGHQAKTAAIDAALAEAEATVELNSLFWPTLTVGDDQEAPR